MRKIIVPNRVLALAVLVLCSSNVFSQDSNFHIYLCFGQSNMEGSAPSEAQDMLGDSRFKVFEAVDCNNLGRVKGNWYTAVPPLCRCWTGLTPSDYFGKTMIANLPDSISVGVINVSVAGCNINLFDKDIYQDFDSTYTDDWFQNILKEYDGNPYGHLIDLALQAQHDGVIKGILLHQGETNTGDTKWPASVKKIYEDMLSDLSLSADSVPLLAGEMFSGEGNCCSSMNPIINTLPSVVPTAHIISSSGCAGKDEAHFDSEGYRILGRRYGEKMLSLMGYETSYSESECNTLGESWRIMADNDASNGSYITAAITELENISGPPADDLSVMQMNVTLKSDTTYYVYGRFNNPSDKDDSFWVKIDDGEYELIDNLTTTGWEWLELNSYELSAGTHTISIAFGENGVALDKLVIKNSQKAPVGVGEEANNVCEPDIYISGINNFEQEGFTLEQNYPNPFSSSTSISFDIPSTSYVSLKVFNMLGDEVAELAGREFCSGNHTFEFKSDKLAAGHYYYTISTDRFLASRKMIMLAQ